MKKSIMKISGLAIVAALMFYNVQVFQANNDADITLAGVQNTALADTEIGVQGCTECVLTGGWTCVNILCDPNWTNPDYDCTSWIWC